MFFVIIASIKTIFINLIAILAIIYTLKAPMIALLQHTKGDRPLINAIMLKQKKNNIARFTDIDFTFNGIFLP